MIRPADPHATPHRATLRERVIVRLLGVPLFWKLLWAGVAVSAGTLLVALVMAPRNPEGLSPTGFLLLFLGLTLGTALAQAFVLHVALSPLASLENTAERVRRGDRDARAGASRVEDLRLRRLRVSFNGMLDEIEAARREQERIARETLVREEIERKGVALELYGEPAQALAGLLVRLRLLVRSNPELSGPVEEIEEGIRDALEEVRRLARRLRPPELDELGVRAALAAHIRSRDFPADTEPAIEGRVPDDRLPAEAALTLFRICQVAVNRALAGQAPGADPLRISFRPLDDRMVVDLACPPMASRRDDQEFAAWAERVRWTGGHLSSHGDDASGQRLRLTLPFIPIETPLVRAVPLTTE